MMWPARCVMDECACGAAGSGLPVWVGDGHTVEAPGRRQRGPVPVGGTRT